MALAEGRLEGALAALRTVTCDDFADAGAASEYLGVLADPGVDHQLRCRAILALSALPLRSA